MTSMTPGAKFRQALNEEKPLQAVGAINAYHAILAKASGFKAIYVSGGGVAAGSLGVPDLGISNLDDVLTDVRRDAIGPLLAKAHAQALGLAVESEFPTKETIQILLARAQAQALALAARVPNAEDENPSQAG